MKKILIVEDEVVLQDVYNLVLTAKGYEVTISSNGAEGLKALTVIKPDLILLDMFMPLMDGREFLNNYDRASYPDVKIIVYTNLSDSKTENDMLSLGADKFILKSSMTPADLIKLVSETLGEGDKQ